MHAGGASGCDGGEGPVGSGGQQGQVERGGGEAARGEHQHQGTDIRPRQVWQSYHIVYRNSFFFWLHFVVKKLFFLQKPKLENSGFSPKICVLVCLTICQSNYTCSLILSLSLSSWLLHFFPFPSFFKPTLTLSQPIPFFFSFCAKKTHEFF